MRITDALLGEHAALYDLFEQLRAVAAEGGDMGEFQGAMRMAERVLLSHARMEEELLFPRLATHLGPVGPLAVMQAEHDAIDEFVEAIRKETDRARVTGLVENLLDIASDHFRKEEMVLFGMAQRFLGDETLIELGEQWADARKVALGGGGCQAGR